MSTPRFTDEWRAEYDAHVLDVAQRQAKAKYLRRALEDARLWNSPRRILDVGCGAGLLLDSLDSSAAKIGCDIRAEPFLTARRTRAMNIRFLQADAAGLPFRAEQFDLVLCLAAVAELSDWRTTLGRMAACVAPGGLLYLTLTNGVSLTRAYALAKKFRVQVPMGWQLYAKNSLPFFETPASTGWGIVPIKNWRYVDVTPFLARAQFSGLRFLPVRFLAWVLQWGAPSFALVWQRPREEQA